MSRTAKKPVVIPGGVEISINDNNIRVKGPKGVLQLNVATDILIKRSDNEISFVPQANFEIANAIVGTSRALLSNMVIGVTEGFERKLVLIGVGFKAQVQDKFLNLSLGFSHPVKIKIPDGIVMETPTQTEIIIRGADKCLVGQIAAEIRGFRSPEPYKGKGVRYDGEVIIQKEGKKK
ncbi:MAG: 50S ribosomal protein L6 [Coxiellaceae bacterium]|nr:50S ribosomal protein L6 [Coxiellaceae bacterium]